MPNTTNDIDALLRMLNQGGWENYHSALTALVAERDALKQRVAELEESTSILRWRVTTMLAEQRPAASDLRERLVCAIWPEIMRQWREYKDAIDPRGDARSDALIEADKMLAAMRKGDANAE